MALYRWVCFVLILIGLYELGVGLFQCIQVMRLGMPYYTVCGTFENPAPYSILIVLILPLALDYALFVRFRHGQKVTNMLFYLSAFYLLFSVVILVMCVSRAAWVASVISLMSMFWLRMKCAWIKKCFVLLAVFVLCVPFLYGMYVLKKDSADGRLFIWKISYPVAKQQIFSGVGIGGFPYVYGEAQEAYFREGKGTQDEEMLAGAPDYAYNEYLQIWIELGLPGVLSCLCLMAYVYIRLLRCRNVEVVGLCGAMVSFMVVSLFSYPLRCFATCLLSLLILLWAAWMPMVLDEKKRNRKLGMMFGLLLVVGVEAMVCVRFNKSYRTWTAVKRWDMVRPYFDREKYEGIENCYRVLYPDLKKDVGFLFEYGMCLSYNGHYEESNIILNEGAKRSSDPMFFNLMGKNFQALGKFEEAEEMFYKAYYRVPHRIYPLYLLMGLYEKEGRDLEMLEKAHQIVGKKEKVPSSLTGYLKKEAGLKLQEYERSNGKGKNMEIDWF
ncbi:O-antigen ligase family protein [Paraprevotella xylaniphila]|uniref:O-antigen ligase family protein n=1 Tax=Paraprevotella xylaniphila TaxID=454155 RepID=UPI00266660F9|nr:O-antigen ligase family protein [Paraprevotella xylaniphila]